MISGSLVDVAFPDLLQFLHLSGRSGTLYLERDGETAYVSFHLGRIASAWCPASMTVVDYLHETGRLRTEDVVKARAIHAREPAHRTLGEILISIAGVKRDDLRDAVARKIEQTVFELVAWRRGTFRFVVEEVRYDEEILFAPRDVAPRVDLDTQVVLMEALRLFDEKARDSRPSLRDEAARAVAAADAATAAAEFDADTATVERGPRQPDGIESMFIGADRVDVTTRDLALQRAVGDALARLGAERAAVGETPAAVIVCDLAEPHTTDRIASLHRESPAIAIVAIAGAAAATSGAYLRGAAAVVPRDADAIAACCDTLVRAARRPDGPLTSQPPVDRLARLLRFVEQIRSGAAPTNLPGDLMAVLAQSVDRGVLLLTRRETLVALTAFGRTVDELPLANATRGLRLLVEAGGPFAHCLATRAMVSLDWNSDDVPDGLRSVLGRPGAGRGFLFPVLGARRNIAIVYLDNGDRIAPIDDVEILELAIAQFGLAIENEILHRQIER